MALVIVSAGGCLLLIATVPPLFGVRWPATAAVVVVVPILGALLAGALVLARTPRLRLAIQAWLLALPLALVMVPAAMLPPAEAQVAAALRVALAGAYLGALRVFIRWRFPTITKAIGAREPVALATGLAALPALPWLAWGAFGSLLDIALGALAAALIGVIACLLVTRIYLRPITGDSQMPGAFARGTVIGVLLLILGLNYGIGGQMPVLLLSLPAMGWLAAAVAGTNHGGTSARTLALLIALVAAPPLLLADPDTLAIELLFQGREGIYWALSAAFAGVVLALLAASIAPALRARLARTPRLAVLGAVACWVVGAGVYGGIGQPGLYGDRVFVILKDQADLAPARRISDYQARRRAVYETLTRHAGETQAPLRASLDMLGIRYTPYYLVNGLEVDGGLPVRLWLATRPEVDRIVPDPILRPLPAPLEVERGDESLPDEPDWNLTMIGADRVWRELGVRGAGIVVGVLDSGVQWDHPELRNGYRGLNAGGTVEHAYNWYDPWEDTPAPVDYSGHGTYTLSAAIGDRVGVAPDATWIGCVNLARNVGNAARYLDCMQFMLAPFPPGSDPLHDGDPARGADITNNSWGCPQDLEGCDPNTLLAAAEALRTAGMFTVAAAGNDGPACGSLKEPLALYDAVFTVGAVTRDGIIAQFSSAGPVVADGSGRIKPDIAAPGAGVRAAAPGGGYMIASGTSIAAPHVTGIVALMWSANPALIGDVARTEEILRATARPGAPPDAAASGCIVSTDIAATPNIIYGAGIIDAYEAVRSASAFDTHGTQPLQFRWRSRS
ncbi:MAG: S8 family serine peptidase [Chloroflexi bacterium]|nr:S8 family serine peptidase [Chloroflexota bacterium]